VERQINYINKMKMFGLKM